MPRRLAATFVSAVLLGVAATLLQARTPPSAGLNPAAWGSDHVGAPAPAYVTGDECLFCHRDVGPTWGANRHQQTLQAVAPDAPELQALGAFAGDKIASETKYLLGAGDPRRFLKRSPHYGKLELLSVSLAEIEGREGDDLHAVHWDPDAFGDRCAGCHATAVDAETRAFSALSLECFTCHGDVSLEHTKQPSLVLLSAKNREPRVVASICGQCHLRGGTSLSSGLPYPNNFVAGDNLFRDFQVDFSDEAIAQLAPLDRHVWLSVRSVVQGGGATTCLDCHDVHAASTARHAAVARDAMCAVCHKEDSEGGVLNEDYLQAIAAGRHSDVCQY